MGAPPFSSPGGYTTTIPRRKTRRKKFFFPLADGFSRMISKRRDSAMIKDYRSAPVRKFVPRYVSEMRVFAERHDCLFVDLYTLTENCFWLIHDDHVHFNDVAHDTVPGWALKPSS
jgi:hypothetical protein